MALIISLCSESNRRGSKRKNGSKGKILKKEVLNELSGIWWKVNLVFKK